MKTDIVSKISRLSRALLAAALALAGTASVKAADFFYNTIGGTVNLGNASGAYDNTGATYKNWAIFTLGGNVTITDPSPYTPGSVPSYDVIGNVGISGSGRLSMSNSYIDGTVTETSAGQRGSNVFAGNNSNPYYNGTIGLNSAYISQGVADAIAASNAAAALTATHTAPGNTAVITTAKDESSAFGITGGGQPGQTYVINLTDLILQGASAALVLHGDAATNYVINISRYMSLAGGAKITLAGGLTEANVLYNVKSNATQYDVTLSGGSEAHGIILATTRAVKETGNSVIYGEVIAKSVSLSGASNVINPLTSP